MEQAHTGLLRSLPVARERSVWIDQLRSFVTVLVVAHHSAMSYAHFSYFDPVVYIRSTHPVVDNARWVGMDIFIFFNDSFFMPLMFWVSGLFLFRGLAKKGRVLYLGERFRRLGIPFVVAVVLLIPVAYIPAYLQIHHGFSPADFISDYLSVQGWPVGPPWFIWLLLAFTILAVFIPMTVYEKINLQMHRGMVKPGVLVLGILVVLALAYIPLSMQIGAYTWTGIGPFDFQLNRVLFYFAWFIFGCCLGSDPWEQYFFSKGYLLGKPWLFWLITAVMVFLLQLLLNIHLAEWNNALFAAWINDAVFVLEGLLMSFAMIAVFRWFSRSSNRVWRSLSANAFGIYLVHYPFVVWFQYILLTLAIPAPVKFSIVFSCSLLVSWAMVAGARKIPLIGRTI